MPLKLEGYIFAAKNKKCFIDQIPKRKKTLASDKRIQS
jgi:hypothetical protein